MNSTIRVKNISESSDIYVRFRPVDDANIPQPPENCIHSSSSDEYSVQGGTMNMFVWVDTNSPPVWKGIVPTKIKKDLIIDPEKKKVYYDSLEIPEGFNPVTGHEIAGTPAKYSTLHIILFVLCVVLLIILIWYLFG